MWFFVLANVSILKIYFIKGKKGVYGYHPTKIILISMLMDYFLNAAL
jgi:hypothetical protein